MNTFPVTPEHLRAFPVGTLGLLVAVASTVAAEHGPENARRLCAELAANDDLWAYIARHLASPPPEAIDVGPPPETPSSTTSDADSAAELEPIDVAPDTERRAPAEATVGLAPSASTDAHAPRSARSSSKRSKRHRSTNNGATGAPHKEETQ
jgi:hypothetical protein